MADTTPVVTTTETPAVADSVTRATFDETKARADDAAAQLASAQAKLQQYEARERATLQSYQPAMESYMKELATEFSTADTKGHFDSMLDWTRSCHERGNLETQMPLGVVLHAAASKLKRTREEASVQSATADQLAAVAKENELLKENIGTKEARIGELDTSLKEMQENQSKLQLQLEKAGMLQEKFDFSKATSREADAVKTDGGITTKTENASKGALGAVPMVDPSMALFQFVSGSGAATGRFMPSASNHSLLGAPSGSDIGLGNALRPM
jgi:predicted  nucleic acid-binding Zn-ribbon protein